MKEIWKTVPGWPAYEASTFGRVRSIPRTVPYCGGADRKLKGKILKIHWRLRDGYGAIDFCADGVRVPMRVHNVIAMTFIGQKTPGEEVRHRNGKKSDNRPTNLVYGTKSQNESDKVLHGTSNRGERCATSKLTVRQVKRLRMMYETNRFPDRVIADHFGISRRHVQRVAKGERWGWL